MLGILNIVKQCRQELVVFLKAFTLKYYFFLEFIFLRFIIIIAFVFKKNREPTSLVFAELKYVSSPALKVVLDVFSKNCWLNR